MTLTKENDMETELQENISYIWENSDADAKIKFFHIIRGMRLGLEGATIEDIWPMLSKPKCPECGSSNLRASGNGFPVMGIKGPAYFCNNCRLGFTKKAKK